MGGDKEIHLAALQKTMADKIITPKITAEVSFRSRILRKLS